MKGEGGSRLGELEIDGTGELRHPRPPPSARRAREPVPAPADYQRAVGRALGIAFGLRRLVLEEQYRARIDWREIAARDPSEYLGPIPVPPPLRERPCPHCASGRLGARQLVFVDPVEGERWGHYWAMNRRDCTDRTPEQLKREGSLVPGAFLCDRPSEGPFELAALERWARRAGGS